MKVNDDNRKDFVAIINEARTLSKDLADEVERLLDEGREHSLNREQTVRVLKKAVSALRHSLIKANDKAGAQALDGKVDDLVDRIIKARDGLAPEGTAIKPNGTDNSQTIKLAGRNGISPGPVLPTPFFHEIEVPMRAGFVKTTDVQLWSENIRLDLQLSQFRQRNGRGPNNSELLDIMLSNMDLPGLLDVPDVSARKKKDQFEIEELARNIANNGVRKPPILDTDGTLLDGNRRVTACWHILNSDEFDFKQKQRAEYIFVWQLTEHATEEQRTAVVVSLNFEPDCKEVWPEYVRAQKVFDAWQELLTLELRAPGSRRQAELKRLLSRKFALGSDTSTVNRYLKMVEWAMEFEDYHINQNGRDKFEVKHRTNRYFQYFDEISRGMGPGGVAHALGQDEGFKHLVFDLLFDGKFKNWRQIRELKLIYENEEAREALSRAREEKNLELAEDHLENAIAIARTKSASMREVGANTRIESFVKWLEELPLRTVRDNVKPENLKKLLNALKLVEKYAAAVLEK